MLGRKLDRFGRFECLIEFRKRFFLFADRNCLVSAYLFELFLDGRLWVGEHSRPRIDRCHHYENIGGNHLIFGKILKPVLLETVQTVRQPTAATIAESSPPLEASATACEGDPSSQIGVQCSVGRARKLRSPRAANEAPMIAALPLGRTAPPAPASPAAPLNPEDVANIAIATPVVPDSTGPPPQRSRRCENRRVGMVATIYRATGDGATTDGALVLTLCPTTATCAVPTNGHGAGRPGEGARWL
jgi:hypothetical protein